MSIRDAAIVLSDGTVFEGEAIGAEAPDGVTTGEFVFNTVLSGYQEVISDPSYAGQVITFTYPHIGNYGVNARDDESASPQCSGVVIRDLARRHSSWRAESGLEPYLVRHGIAGIAGVDTRRLTRHLRDHGTLPGAFGTADEAALRAAASSAVGTDGRGTWWRRSAPRRPTPHRRPATGIDTWSDRPAGSRRPSCAASPTSARSRWCRRAPVPRRSWRWVPTACSCPTAPATVPRSTRCRPPSRPCWAKVAMFGICMGHQLLATALRWRHLQAAVRSPRRESPRS